ncbi:sirohydrochlorin chelatase [Sulfitobacter sp. JB4-11]|uniref:sirohydrochlorin chelatase n=1 Tax=Sulfitobacter rhodophyticola TaxID=3238304 RepID=UPI0035181D53
MYLTRSPFQTAPAIDRPVLVVTHGSPSQPVVQEIAVLDLAQRLNSLLPNAVVRGATLAAKGSLDRAVAGLDNPIVCPWFMSDGWFVGTHLPKRLRAAGLARWDATPPMGLMPGLGRLMRDRVQARLIRMGWKAAGTTLILAAHGSPTSGKPRAATERAALALARHIDLKAVLPCYVDEAPAIADTARVEGPAIVLPFFAARAGHVTGDLPAALAAADFTGPVLDPVGVWPETPALALAPITALCATRRAEV